MTNREKYIDSMTDKELALFLLCGSQIIDNQIDTNPSLTDDEEKRKQAVRHCSKIEKWLSQETEKSADEMFEELGYEKDTFDEFGADEITYINNNKDHIIVKKNGCYIKYNYYDFHYNNLKFITEAEDKAIHKKIEEVERFESKEVDR